MRRRLTAAAVTGAVAVTFFAATRAVGAPGPTGGEVGAARQVVVVTAASTRARTGLLEAFEVQDGTWVRVIGPVRADLGYGGLVAGDRRRQGSGTTPIGTYGIVSAFGRDRAPATSLPYRAIDRDDVWTFDKDHPETYNLLQTTPRSWRAYGGQLERLWSFGRQYDLVAVLDYNLPDAATVSTGADGVRRTSRPVSTARGGAIFIHVSDGTSTAGCIAIPKAAMQALLAWLDPADQPVTVIRLR